MVKLALMAHPEAEPEIRPDWFLCVEQAPKALPVLLSTILNIVEINGLHRPNTPRQRLVETIPNDGTVDAREDLVPLS
jgi:hypothetical protein